MCLLCAPCVARGTVYVNATFGDLPLDAVITPVPGWNMTIVKTVQTMETGTCGVGFSCAVGTTDPVPCPLGMLGSETADGPECSTPCPQDHYCPNATSIIPCPNNTYSVLGTWSQEGCLCNEGFECAYDRSFSLQVPLNMSIGTWLTSTDMQEGVLNAVLDAMRAPPEKVTLASSAVAID